MEIITKRRFGILAILAAVLLTAAALLATGGVLGAPGHSTAAQSKKTEAEAVNAINAVTFDLYRQLAEDGKNLCFSPYSISTCFAMAYAGARGDTAAEMERALYFSKDIHASNRELISMLKASAKGAVKLDAANSIWPAKGYPLEKAFTKTIRTDYFSDVKPQDYKRDGKGAGLAINRWAHKQTRGRIGDIIDPEELDGRTLMILVNAVYFKAPWAMEFEKKHTKNADFHVSETIRKTVPMMKRLGKYDYTETDDVQIINMPYRGGDFSMIVALPREGQFSRAEKLLSMQWLKNAGNAMEETSVYLILPRFRIEQDFDLGSAAVNLGVKRAFDRFSADFSGISAGRDLYINAVAHKTFLEVDEKGAEAAAVTRKDGRSYGAIPGLVTFCANRPFIYLIRHNESGAIIFAGRVVEP